MSESRSTPHDDGLHVALTCIDQAVELLQERGYKDDSSTLHALSIARGHVREWRDHLSVARSESERIRWIPISERVPEKNDLVLVVHDGRKITKQKPTEPTVGVGYWNGYEADASKKWHVCKDRLYMYFGCLWPDAESVATWGEVTHWMPLPEKP